MYFPVGWPRVLHIPQVEREPVRHIVSNRDRSLFAVCTDDSIGIWYTKPSVLIVSHRRSCDSLAQLGSNVHAIWRTDASMLVVVTTRGHMIFFQLSLDNSKTKSVYNQNDSKIPSLQRESAELFIKDTIPAIWLTCAFDVKVPGGIMNVVTVRDELVVATETGQIERYKWDGRIELDSCYELAHIPFSVDQQNSRAKPFGETSVYVSDLEYSPTLGGFAVVLSDGRGALLIVPNLRQDPNHVRGLWAVDVQDATCVAINHKYLLVAYGRLNGQTVVCHIDEVTGGLQISHNLVLGNRDYPDAASLGAIRCARWTPDGCALLVAWKNGGLGMWSVFGTLLLCTLGWDYGLTQDLTKNNPLIVESMDWGPEGYHLWLSIARHPCNRSKTNHLCVIQFVKSALSVNPCVSTLGHVVLQGDDRLYLNASEPVTDVWKQRMRPKASSLYEDGSEVDAVDASSFHTSTSSLLANKQWIVIMLPSTYNSTNWPIRYVAVDKNGQYAAIAGRTGVAHCSLQAKKWKLFGNETQEKDFIVTGSLLWWKDHLLMGCYNIPEEKDEVRLYPRDAKLDNAFVRVTKMPAQILLINVHRNRLAIFTTDNHIAIFSFVDNVDRTVHLVKEQDIDITNLSVHPVCITNVVLMTSRTDVGPGKASSTNEIQSVLVNVCGKVVMFQLTVPPSNLNNNNAATTVADKAPVYVNPTVLASSVENLWVSGYSNWEKKHLVEAVFFACGSLGMKVWLPLFPRDGEKPHNFMSKWIMLPLNINIYPLTVLFEDAMVLGAENDAVLYPAEPGCLGTVHPFSIIERTSQVYLHHILRQLLRRNLGFHAWEIARSCTSLPYFPHTLELLLHEVLEEEATSKEPIPDALLPRVVEFIHEFPVYLQTIVQCARKIEIALWPHLFATVGQPHHLFQECLQRNHLATGASYLIILQNLESSSVSRQYATRLLDAALDSGAWELCKDLVRFLRAIDPRDVESPTKPVFGGPSSVKYSMALPTPPPVSPTIDDVTFVLGTVQVPRPRTFSVSKVPEAVGLADVDVVRVSSDPKNIPVRRKSGGGSGQMRDAATTTAEEFFLDVILQRHARKLLSAGNLRDLGCFSAHLDFHLVTWLRKERSRAGKVDDFVSSLKKLHRDFQWPYPVPPHNFAYLLQRKDSGLPSLDEKLHGLLLDPSSSDREETRDSGYLSHSGGLDTKPPAAHFGPEVPSSSAAQTLEAQLRPHVIREDESVRTLDLSEESSLWGEGDHGTFADEASWNSTTLCSDLQHMSAELASKGPAQSEVQLRYLLQLMMEANCLEWAVLISVVLRDAMAVLRIVNAARAADVSREVTVRLREGMSALEHWADHECLGYRRFMHTLRSQSVVLNKLSCSKLRIRPPSPMSDSDSAPSTASGVPEDSLLVVELQDGGVGNCRESMTREEGCGKEVDGFDDDDDDGGGGTREDGGPDEQTTRKASVGMECAIS